MIIKKLFGIIVFLLLAMSAFADDDIMITRDGEKKKVKIERISPSQVTYIDLKQKKRGNQDVSTTFVYMILREKGKNIFFDEDGNQMTSPVVKYDKKDDVVLLNKGEMVVVYNLSTSKDELKYQLQDKKKAPWVNTPKSEVFMVMNSDGTTTLYYEANKQKLNTAPQGSNGAAAASETPVAQAAVSSTAASGKRYKVGDIYNENGLKGLVVNVDQTGQHGLIMSLNTCSKKWIGDSDAKLDTNCFYEDDGEKNMAVAQQYIEENGKTWAFFPFFEWCRSLGPGWYAPAIEELKYVAKAINGDMGKENSKQIKEVEDVIKSNGGDALRQKILGKSTHPFNMLSSTEGEHGYVQILMFQSAIVGKGKFVIFPWQKGAGGKMVSMGSRAVHKF